MTGFRFKQFFIRHDQCAMKVGTDGILLGAWASNANCQHILDLGTGSGLVAIMLAQRYPQAQITGVEYDTQATQQAKENAKACPWQHNIHIVGQSIEQFVASRQGSAVLTQFDLIVANPPYFAQGVACSSAQRELARYQQQSHFAWLTMAQSCLGPQGKICFVLPVQAANLLKTQAKQTALYCIEQCDIITKMGKTPHRTLISFAQQASPLRQDNLVIYDQNNQYTDKFKQLTQAFYLKF
ncbi:tRNA1(Val) (adenine(37)-N6)-methyltransferase [Volucribacter amazonae]|uniref:tRNA1(Val) (adenine(37)-N6)-methyltransferase n=1 Tax=Volucribacter amazonae TaxID=256731 RepID=A0A9X4PAJ1_9PAST|nr:tRNA1(Val) (adenine(37)-N6)-methyltransferase [Volucribacter amazonae]MDG6894712.1 tRNA (adenine-N(6)-)-methyltransferase [Volucribacter amazonae]